MVANVRCAEISNEQLRNLEADQAWKSVTAAAGSGVLVPGFGTTVHGLTDSCIKGYEAEAAFFDAAVREDKRVELRAQVQSLVLPLVEAQTATLSGLKLRELQLAIKLEGAEGNEGFANLSARSRAAALAAFSAAFEANVKVEGFPWDGKVGGSPSAHIRWPCSSELTRPASLTPPSLPG
jgi:hypothetical protein